ncbi:MAG: hypothetical protein QM482_06535 [Sulfurospirillum sp.]
MSNLTKNEKQALNDLFASLKEKRNSLEHVKNSKRTLVFVFGFLFKFKKAASSLRNHS